MLFRKAFKKDFTFVILDRIIFSNSNKEKIAVQKIRDKTYASILCWLFSETNYKRDLKPKYRLIEGIELEDSRNSYKYEKDLYGKEISMPFM